MKAWKTLFLVSLIMAFPSCKNPLEQYGDTVVDTYKRSQTIEKKESVQNLQRSIQAFQATNGRYPNDLKELEEFNGNKLDYTRYEYNPSTGIITAKE